MANKPKASQPRRPTATRKATRPSSTRTSRTERTAQAAPRSRKK